MQVSITFYIPALWFTFDPSNDLQTTFRFRSLPEKATFHQERRIIPLSIPRNDLDYFIDRHLPFFLDLLTAFFAAVKMSLFLGNIHQTLIRHTYHLLNGLYQLAFQKELKNVTG